MFVVVAAKLVVVVADFRWLLVPVLLACCHHVASLVGPPLEWRRLVMLG